MKKSLLAKLCILSLVVVCAAMSFVACKVTTKSITVNGKSQVFAGEFALADYSLTVSTSDGNTRTEPLTAQNLANVTVEQLQRAGMYNISVVYDGVTTTFALTVVNRTFDGLTFADKTVTYNGSAQSIEVTNLPQGATVTYSPTNTCTNAGIYPVTATVSAPNFDTVTLSATLTINKASYDMSRVVFADKSVAYDGNAHSLEATNLPDGVTVTYIGNNQTNVGTYTVLAVFSGDSANYNPIVNMTATLTINKATYDMSRVVFADKSVAYDGNTHSIEATNLPSGVTATYIGNNQTNVGTYTVLAVFSGDSVNYNSIANMTATLTVTQNKVQGVTFADRTVTYDGAAHSLAIEGNLPQGIAVVYDGNSQTNAGTYNVTAKFVGSNPNYEQLPDMTATLTIEKRELQIEFVGEKTVAYTGYAQKPLTARATNLCGSDVVAIDITYDGDVVQAGTYVATATVDSDNYKLTVNNTCTFTITRATHKVTFRQNGQPDKVYNVLDLADFAEAFPDVVPVENYDVAWEEKQLTRVTEDVIVNAIITPTVYEITYILDGGTIPADAPRQYTIETETFDLPVPQRDYYSFEGWYAEETFVNRVAQISQGSIGNVTLYGKWQQTSTRGVQYEQLEDGSYAVSGYDGDSGEVLIPLTWKGQPVTAIGDEAFYNCSGLTSITIPDSVASIGDGAFYNCSGLTSVTIGNGVTSIGDLAFRGCSGLTSIFVNKENGKYMVKNNCLIDASTATLVLGCQTSVIPTDGSVTSIGNDAFSGCSGLTDITIPDSVTSIGGSAFFNCDGLKSVTIPDSVTYVGSDAFGSCDSLVYNKYDNAYYLGNATNKYVVLVKATSTSVTSCTINGNCKIVAQLAFSFCNELTSIFVEEGNGKYIVKNNCLIDTSTATLILGCQTSVIPVDGSITNIGSYAFYNCSKLTSITIPDSVTSIGSFSFSYCRGLTSVTIGNNVTSIGYGAFSGCSGLTSITIPDGITTIGENVFFLCQNLQYNEFDNAKYLGNAGNKYLVLVTAKSTNITSCSINVKCTFVLNKAFRGCSGLISITIPDSVKSIGQYAFRGCSGLTSVTIGNSVTSIGLYAFSGCDGLTEIHYNGDLTGWFKISGIYSLMSYGKSTKTLYVGGTKIEGDLVIPEGVKYIGSYAFSGCNGLTSVTIGKSVTSIGNYAFSGCSGLARVKIPDSVKSIGDYTFSGCSGLTSITIPDSVKSIGEKAFYKCKLTSIKIPDSVTSIGFGAFSVCGGLTSVTIGNAVTSIGNSAFV